MNKVILSLCAVATLGLAACTNRIDDIFDQSSVERLETNKAKTVELLTSSTNGWIMEYFPQADIESRDVQKHKGHTFLMRFSKDGTVIVGAMDNGMFKTETSQWDVISDNSTVLTFNTYNALFHLYANPDPEGDLFNVDGVGFGGDYEFKVLDYNEEQNYQLLKGKKRSTYIRLYPLAAGQDWANYFQQIQDMENYLFPRATQWTLTDGDTKLDVYYANSYDAKIVAAGGDTLSGGLYYGLIVTPKGIRFHTALNEVGSAAQTFNLNSDRTLLVAEEDNATLGISVYDFFYSGLTNNTVWTINLSDINATAASYLATVNAQLSAVVANSNVSALRLQYNAARSSYVLAMQYSLNGSVAGTEFFDFDVTLDNQQISLNYKGTGTANAMTLLGNFPALSSLINAFNGTYALTAVHPFDLVQGVQLVNISDTNVWYKMTGN